MDVSKRLDLLRAVPGFRTLPPGALADVAAVASVRRFERGELLCRQGDDADGFYVLESGEVDIFLRRRTETVRIAAGGRGAVMGEMALITRSPRVADVVGRVAGEALCVSSDAFHALEESRPELLEVLTEIAAARLGSAAVDGLGDKVFDDFRIVRTAGRGASAVVYEAEDVRDGRRVALKMLSHRLARDRAAMDWFDDEAELLAGLDHPAIARCHGTFDAYGTRFLVFDFVDGPTVADLIARVRPVPEAAVRAIAGTVAAALAYVHERGVVHGDVKPANVMLSRTGRVRLTDFGIASSVTGDDAARPETVRVHGTPRYMAPEMFVGAPPSPATDLYALGCLLWELATGRSPFEQRSIGPLVLAKREFTPPPASSIRAGLGADLHASLAGLLEPDPGRRWTAAPGLIAGAADVDSALASSAPSASAS